MVVEVVDVPGLDEGLLVDVLILGRVCVIELVLEEVIDFADVLVEEVGVAVLELPDLAVLLLEHVLEGVLLVLLEQAGVHVGPVLDAPLGDVAFLLEQEGLLLLEGDSLVLEAVELLVNGLPELWDEIKRRVLLPPASRPLRAA